ncbi:uncharacterized protein LOC107366969 isoform X2 [Tetranychus urticae]|uniref:Protein TsetseEP domain-containing protein n=1 Tax=Tetranychus urticae TaxID=32264 RepID=T1KSN6_TETUR|nr:uncharacterized protein LOC107366969 isoform X2 [Tetranychus urticae]
MKVSVVLVFTVIFISASVSASDENSSTSVAARQARFEERKLRYEQDKKDIQSFMTTKNLFKTVVKILFGTSDESAATSRQVLNVLVQALDMIRNSFSQRARSSTSRGLREAVDDATVAGVTMLRGYVKSVLAGDDQCAQRHLCESSKDAIREGRELGYIVSQVGGYASSYLLQQQKSIPSTSTYDAVRRGRSGEDCAKIYTNCNEAE